MKEELVRIHARLCGDGCVCVYETSEKDRDMRGEVKYTNLDEKNMREFMEDMEEIFDVKTTRYKDSTKVKSLRVVNQLEEKFGKFSSGKWTIPKQIFELDKEKKYEWIRAFVRDEGYYDHKNNALRIKSMNENGVRDIRMLLADIGIDANVTGPNCDNSWYVSVYGLDGYPRLQKIAASKKKIRG
jgi:hypothetical protein